MSFSRSCSRRRRSLMSRVMLDAPITRPRSSQIGDIVNETSICFPSLCRRNVSNLSTRLPSRSFSKMKDISPDFSGGTRVEIFSPIISSAV